MIADVAARCEPDVPSAAWHFRAAPRGTGGGWFTDFDPALVLDCFARLDEAV